MHEQGLNMKLSQFGAEIRSKHFSFAEGYRPLNHGSFGTIPRMVQEYQRQLQLETEARPDTFIRYTYLKLLKESRSAVAPLLGADPGEVVLIPNATTGVNTVLRNLSFDQGDVILCFNTIYGACAKTIQALSETCPVSSHQIDITYPIEDDEIVRRFRLAAEEVKAQGKQPKLAMFDTVLTFPGARFPWEALVATCKELGIMSLIDGAHGVGHIDLTNLGEVGPDFMVSNCYKWLMVPRGCAVLYVPFRNQKLISSTLPTSWGYEARDDRAKMGPLDYFSRLFDKVSTTDNTPYCCIPLALKFRSEICGGEARILKYCEDIARQGGAKMAEILDTEILGGSSSSFQHCCFTNVRLPLTLEELAIDESCGRKVAKWMQELTPAEYETYLPIKLYDGQFWCRISGQIYLTLDDFEWASRTLLQLCERAKKGEWK
ncbi:L-cysteine desulfhydrase [Madurella mycetomatis]|uniref:L-cysteine desulfhydrase n=1 Tax=Madurella mycetomatis TaxID=100816 RepID=A0A175VQ58_9PEZI|nr:L-cysteine desulfhydrase [Madurella mycetomatis]